MAVTSKLSDNFLNELFKCCFYKKEVIESTILHLKYNYIPNELKGYKKILRSLDTYYSSYGKIPTIGIITQSCNDTEVSKILSDINKIQKIPETFEILESLTQYIKRVKFQELHQNLVDLYNSDKAEEAIELQAIESAKIVNFSIHKDTSYFQEVFSTFEQRSNQRVLRKMSGEDKTFKIPFGLDFLDARTHGGIDKSKGETSLYLGRSGTGKTTFLRHLGIAASRRGYDVLHIQAEGTEEESLEGYDAAWTGIYKSELADIDSSTESQLRRVVNDIRNKGGRLVVVAYEQFGSVSMLDVRNTILDYHKVYGKYPDVLVMDYLGLFDPGNGKRYSTSFEGEKMRKEASARQFRNICNEFRIAGHTADQVDSIAPSDYNNPAFVITRYNCNLAKGLPESFSYVFSGNLTNDEYNNNTLRFHIDKMRNYKGVFTFKIATNYDRARFYDRLRTLELFSEDYNR